MMDRLTGIHINWTKPAFAAGKSEYRIESHELLTTVLSALEWKKHYGRMILYTDPVGKAYYESIGYLPLWDEVRELHVPASVSAASYWAAGKLYALADVREDVCMIDTDFILWENLKLNAPVTVAHLEPVGNAIYPKELSYYRTDLREFYGFDAKALACNTAFCCFRDRTLKEKYLDAAFAFMENSDPKGNTLQYMVCAEQRMLGMILKRERIAPAVLLHEGNLHTQRICTHTWGYKNTMRADGEKARNYCVRLARRIGKDFPQWEEKLLGVETLYPYFCAVHGPAREIKEELL